jgi:hypothetical protein
MFTDREVVGAVLAELKAVTGLSWEVWQTGGGCEAYGAVLPSGESFMMADDGALIEWGESTHVSLGFFSADEAAAEDWRDCRELGGWGEGFGPLGFDSVLEFVRESFVLWGLGVVDEEEDGDCYCCIASYPDSYLENVADFIDDAVVLLCRDCAAEWRRTAERLGI